MKALATLVVAMSVAGCSTSQVDAAQTFTGYYVFAGETLELRPDGSFTYDIGNDCKSEGTWRRDGRVVVLDIEEEENSCKPDDIKRWRLTKDGITRDSATRGDPVLKRGKWRSDSVEEGPDSTLCEILHQRLNASSDDCAVDAIETYPEFSLPPWQSLNPRDHFDLLVKLLRYQQLGPRRYFNEQLGPNDRIYESRAQSLLDDDAEMTIREMKIWRTNLLDPIGSIAPTDGAHNFVLQLTLKASVAVEKYCPGKSSTNWLRFTFLVLPDLSGPDPKANSGSVAISASRWIVMHEGKPLLINYYSVARPTVVTCSFNQIDQLR